MKKLLKSARVIFFVLGDRNCPVASMMGIISGKPELGMF
jgi:hypothetical protein